MHAYPVSQLDLWNLRSIKYQTRKDRTSSNQVPGAGLIKDLNLWWPLAETTNSSELSRALQNTPLYSIYFSNYILTPA